MDAGHAASQVEPVGFADVALGDREKARQPRFGGQQVVIGGITTAWPLVVREAIADGEQLPLRVVEKPEIHVIEQGDSSPGQVVEMQPLQRSPGYLPGKSRDDLWLLGRQDQEMLTVGAFAANGQ